MDVVKNFTFDIDEAIEFIRVELLQEDGIELDKSIIDKILLHEETYMIAKGIAIPIDEDEDDV